MDTILALDIGTEYVKAILAKPKENGNLEVIGVGRAHQAPSNMYSGAIADIPAVVAICEKALSEAEEEAGCVANTTVVGIAGELVKGNTSSVRYRRKNSNTPITEQEMNLIIKQVQKKAGDVAHDEIAAETNNPNVDIRLINSAIVSLTIDGYKISNPIGFKGSELSIQFYTAFAPLIHVAAIEKVCAELNLDLLAVAVEPFAVCRACLGENVDSNFSGIVMDIGGGTTDIAVVDDGGVEGTKMFSIGGRSFTHQIAKAIGSDFNSAEKYKLSLDDSEADEIIISKISKAIDRNIEVWLSGVTVALEDFNLVEILPNNILLCGGGASLGKLQETLALSDWYKQLSFSRRPVIQMVEIDTLPGVTISSQKELDQSFVTAIGLLRVGVDTLSGAPEGNGLRAKLAKLLQN